MAAALDPAPRTQERSTSADRIIMPVSNQECRPRRSRTFATRTAYELPGSYRSTKALVPRTRRALLDAAHRGPPIAASNCNCEAGMLNSSKIGAVVFIFGAVAAIPAARAYTIETHFTAKCHEKLTAQALRNARAAL